MKTFLVRLILTACAFYFLLPMVPGFHLHGNFLHALATGFIFSLLVWLVEFLAISISIFLTITSFGTAIIFLAPVWLIGFWFFPAVVLKLTAQLLPQYLTIDGWIPAILGGFTILLISALTSDGKRLCRIGD